MARKRLLITGVSGLLGNNLAVHFKDQYQVLGLYHCFEPSIEGIEVRGLDLIDPLPIRKIIDTFQPDTVVHSAALTNIEYCEAHQQEAFQTNVTATKNVIHALEGSPVKLVYISTDAVYDGTKGNYIEEDKPNPLNYYAQTKLQGEEESAKRDHTLIARTNIFGRNIQEKQCLAEWIIGELKNKRSIKGFADVFFSSIYTMDFARLLDAALHKDLKGIYHIASSTSMSKYDFAVQIAKLFELDSGLIEPISVDDFDFKGKRGKDLSLIVDKLSSGLGQDIPDMEETIRKFQDHLKIGEKAQC